MSRQLDREADAGRRMRNDLAEHQLEIVLDDGVHRHLRFRSPKSSFYWMDLITWPGNLVIRSDMGDYMFSRTKDMFEFFAYKPVPGINPSYWGEKLTAVDPQVGYREFSETMFIEYVVDEFLNHVDWHGIEHEEALDLWRELEEQVLEYPDDESWSRRALDTFRYDPPEGKTSHENLEFTDTWEHDFKDFTYHYLWCCHAILWGIGMYRTMKAASNEMDQSDNEAQAPV